jgi:hypothetical protein
VARRGAARSGPSTPQRATSSQRAAPPTRHATGHARSALQPQANSAPHFPQPPLPPSPLPPSYEEEYREEYAWAHQQTQHPTYPHRPSLPQQSTESAAEDIMFGGARQGGAREAVSDGSRAVGKLRSRSQTRKGTVAGEAAGKAAGKATGNSTGKTGKAAGQAAGKAVAHRERSKARKDAGSVPSRTGNGNGYEGRPAATAMRRRREGAEALAQQRELL